MSVRVIDGDLKGCRETNTHNTCEHLHHVSKEKHWLRRTPIPGGQSESQLHTWSGCQCELTRYNQQLEHRKWHCSICWHRFLFTTHPASAGWCSPGWPGPGLVAGRPGRVRGQVSYSLTSVPWIRHHQRLYDNFLTITFWPQKTKKKSVLSCRLINDFIWTFWLYTMWFGWRKFMMRFKMIRNDPKNC